MKYAIYGAGSLGTVLGAYISKKGINIDLINRNIAHVEALNKNGAKITGGIEMTVPVRAFTTDEVTDGYDIVFLLTKQQQNKEASVFIKNHLSENGIVVTLQNGIPEPDLEKYFGKEKVIGCTVEWGATLKSPGVCEFTSDPSPEKLSFRTGHNRYVPKEMFDAATGLLSVMGPVHISDNFMGDRWSKLLINATFGSDKKIAVHAAIFSCISDASSAVLSFFFFGRVRSSFPV